MTSAKIFCTDTKVVATAPAGAICIMCLGDVWDVSCRDREKERTHDASAVSSLQTEQRKLCIEY
jgi:hypothetical protein